MRDVIKDLNKQTLSTATNISYSRLRKYAAGVVSDLTPEEREKIYEYLIQIAQKFKAE
jgi:hypothetical protein